MRQDRKKYLNMVIFIKISCYFEIKENEGRNWKSHAVFESQQWKHQIYM